MARIFCINSVPRAGTHLLASALDGHPDLRVYGEIFNKNHHDGQVFENETVGQALQRMRERDDWPQIGFCVHRGAVPAIEREIHKRAERKLPKRMRMIILWRQNYLRQFVSLRRAQDVGQWTIPIGGEIPEYKPLRPGILEMGGFFKRMQKHNSQLTKKYTNTLRLSYEQLIREFQPTIARILRFLDAKPMHLDPATVKTGVPLREALANYDALKRAFATTRWSAFFDE